MLRVADLAIGRDALGIELHLNFDIRRRHLERTGELTGKFGGRFLGRIEEAVTAIAVAGR